MSIRYDHGASVLSGARRESVTRSMIPHPGSATRVGRWSAGPTGQPAGTVTVVHPSSVLPTPPPVVRAKAHTWWSPGAAGSSMPKPWAAPWPNAAATSGRSPPARLPGVPVVEEPTVS